MEITPVGEGDGRGCGPVSIRVEGKIAALVDVAEGASACSLLLCSSAQTQQELTKRIWTLTTSLRNAHPGEGSHRDKPYVLEALKNASSPLSTRTLVQQVHRAAGEPPAEAKAKQDWDRIIRCLNYLLKEGVVVVSNAPRDHYRQRFWALAERQSEFWPDGVPTQQGRHLNTRRLLALLESATGPLTCRQIVIATTDLTGLSTKRVQMLCSRMWYCLEHHRKKGVVEKVPMPQWGKRVHGWVIVRDAKERE